MENNKLPLEPEKDIPVSMPAFTGDMEQPEDEPVIQELLFETTPAPEELPEQEQMPGEAPVLAPETQPEAAAAAAEPEPDDPAPVPEPMTEATIPAGEPAPDEAPVPEESPVTEAFPAVEETMPPPAPVPEEVLSQPVLEADPELAALLEEVPEEPFPDQDYRDNGQEFETMFRTPAPEPAPVKPPEPVSTNKGRPKRKKGEGLLGIPSIAVTFVWLALIVIIGVTAGRMLWICAADVLAFGREDEMVTVTIYEADTMDDIIDKLHEGGLIRYKSLFRLYADISDAEEDIKPGIYDLNKRYDYHALVNFMSPRSSREVIKLTIPEGYTCQQIFALLEENRICTALDAAAYAANGALTDYWFLEGVERGSENCLEGYLFPDTYEFYKNSTPKEALERMLDNFNYRFNEEMLAQLAVINETYRTDYTVREIVIIASLIEKESAAPGESPMVSGVIYNRLFNWGNNPPYLNIDASIVYAQEGANDRIDTSLDSPYNTYLYEGLTPGPIANPGLSSLKAALNPESHNYYYYVLNPDTGMHQFSTTYEEHTGYVRQFAAVIPEVQ